MKTDKSIILCADDYGQKEAVSQAIVRLLELGRLSAVSCMVTRPDWPMHWQKLEPYRQQLDVGLHFNLTDGVPLSEALRRSHGFMPLKRLLGFALLRRLDRTAIAAELTAQLEVFRAATGQWPDFIDGHQHIHHFPGIRDALFEVYARLLSGTGCYIRCVYDPRAFNPFASPAPFKRLVLALSGAATFRRRLREQGIPHNPSFSGIYPFGRAQVYGTFFPGFLRAVGNGGLILCHPGQGGMDPTDPLATVRGEELRFLLSPQFVQVCAEAGVRLGRFRDTRVC